MILIKSPSEIEKMRVAGRKTAQLMAAIEEMIEPGLNVLDLEKRASEVLVREGAKTAFKGYMGYPANICVSINEEVVHGIPRDRTLVEGDIVGVDLGAVFDGFFGDMAKTFAIGTISEVRRKLIRVTEESLIKGIRMCSDQNRLGDVSHAVEEWVIQHGFSVVRDFVGHGIGTKMHEDPPVPNYGSPNTGPRLQVGMVLAIEPMVNEGTSDVRILSDGWTVVTKDGKCSAHFEHTVAITRDGPEVLTSLE